jgi:hypothetical protein
MNPAPEFRNPSMYSKSGVTTNMKTAVDTLRLAYFRYEPTCKVSVLVQSSRRIPLVHFLVVSCDSRGFVQVGSITKDTRASLHSRRLCSRLPQDQPFPLFLLVINSLRPFSWIYLCIEPAVSGNASFFSRNAIDPSHFLAFGCSSVFIGVTTSYTSTHRHQHTRHHHNIRHHRTHLHTFPIPQNLARSPTDPQVR